MPCVLGAGGVEKIVEIELDDAARENFNVSVDAVKELLVACKQIDEASRRLLIRPHWSCNLASGRCTGPAREPSRCSFRKRPALKGHFGAYRAARRSARRADHRLRRLSELGTTCLTTVVSCRIALIGADQPRAAVNSP